MVAEVRDENGDTIQKPVTMLETFLNEELQGAINPSLAQNNPDDN